MRAYYDIGETSTITSANGICRHTYFNKRVIFLFFKSEFGICSKCGEFIQDYIVVSKLKWTIKNVGILKGIKKIMQLKFERWKMKFILLVLIVLTFNGCVSMKMENSGNGRKQVFTYKMVGFILDYPAPNLNIEEK